MASIYIMAHLIAICPFRSQAALSLGRQEANMNPVDMSTLSRKQLNELQLTY